MPAESRPAGTPTLHRLTAALTAAVKGTLARRASRAPTAATALRLTDSLPARLPAHLTASPSALSPNCHRAIRLVATRLAARL
jgi:hypothetical protein